MSKQITKNDDKILNSNILNKIFDEELEPTGFNISPTNYSHRQPEKRLQWLTQKQIELLINQSITEETKDTPVDPETGGFLLEDVLLDKIRLLNENTINNFKEKYNLSLSFEAISQKIKQDFIHQFKAIIDIEDCHKNIKLHQLFFNENNDLSVNIEGFNLDYIVIDNNNSKNNEITIIKEKKLKKGANNYEYADFALYYNGLPFIVLEMKQFVVNGENGYRKANDDYRDKTTYHNFLSCIGTDTKTTFISSNPKSLDTFIWQNYKNLESSLSYYDPEDKNGLYDIIKELLISKENLLFYFEICTMPSEDGNYLKNASIQQYMTAKKVYNEMHKNINNSEGFSNYFQHHTRTGKSFTFKIIASMAYKQFNQKYKKCIFFTHDNSAVMSTVQKEFNGLKFPSGSVNKIKHINDYKKNLESSSIFGMYILNMQVIEKTEQVIDDGDDILMLIDEVHTHQKLTQGVSQYNNKKTMADYRRQHFPNASIISATATPLKKQTKDNKGNDIFIDITAQNYGECLDKLTPSDALNLNLVTRLNYHKINYESKYFNEILEKYRHQKNKEQNTIVTEFLSRIDKLVDKNKDTVFNEGSLYPDSVDLSVIDFYNNLQIDRENYLKIENMNPFPENTQQYKQMDILLSSLQKTITTDIQNISLKTKRLFKHSIWETVLSDKIDHVVVPEILSQRRQSSYIPKFFYVVKERESKHDLTNGEIVLNCIKNLISDHIKKYPNHSPSSQFNVKNNIYHGIRFGFDSDSNQQNNNYNGYLGVRNDVTELFEADGTEDRWQQTKPIDVLIIVRKKLMGYDNKNLTTVFLDREIDESNIKEMLQLATRGTTKREGKEVGYIIDLTFNDRNKETYKKALSVYNDQSEIKEFLFDDDEISQSIKDLKTEKESLLDLFLNQSKFSKNNHNDLLNSPVFSEVVEYVKEQYWQWGTNNHINQNNNFFYLYMHKVSEIEKIYKSLLSPKIILERSKETSLLNDIFSIFQMNASLLQDIKNNKIPVYKRHYGKEDVVEILEQTFSSFGGLNSFLEQIDIKGKEERQFIQNNSNDNYQSSSQNSRINSTIENIQKEINKTNNSLKNQIEQELEKISESIDINKEEEIIKKYFDGNKPRYKITVNLEDVFGVSNCELMHIYAEQTDQNIREKMKTIEPNYDQNEKVKILLDEVNFIDIDNIESRLMPTSIYFELFDPENGFIICQKEKLKSYFNDGLDYQYIRKNEDNRLLNILLEYINEYKDELN